MPHATSAVMTTHTAPSTEIRSAGACVRHRGDEPWAIRTICAQSHLNVHQSEVTILAQVGTGASGIRYVMAGGTIVGSYQILA